MHVTSRQKLLKLSTQEDRRLMELSLSWLIQKLHADQVPDKLGPRWSQDSGFLTFPLFRTGARQRLGPSLIPAQL